ncbi:MAG: metallophosphoesterase [Clostridia bacterium]|nr:metallophosphoesterase [Clostridia bacterium]
MVYLIFIIACIIVFSAIFCHFNITVSKYNINNKKIKRQGLKIVQLSDVHGRECGKDSYKIIKKIDKLNPGIIVITGDLLDKGKRKIQRMLEFVRILASKYKCVYVIGNHELYLDKETLDLCLNKMIEYGVVMLNNSYTDLENNIRIYGIGYNLVTSKTKEYTYNRKAVINHGEIEEKIGKLDNTKYNVLLAHSPFSFDAYSKCGFDLILTGHVHGGIIRIPGMFGLLSPEGKFFPKYFEGMYNKEETNMIVNRGIGYSCIPVRIFNSPEIGYINVENTSK